MSAKEQLFAVIDLLGETEASCILDYVKDNFTLKAKSWEDIEEVEPYPDEIEAFAQYRAKS